jgi:outer membrane lipoprotein-sorting protein
MRILFSLLFVLAFLPASAQDEARSLVSGINRRFRSVQDYKANVDMHFDLPGVKMNDMKGKVYFKQPDRFRIRAKGIFFLPRQNPMQQVSMLMKDTAAYTAVITGTETENGVRCTVLNLIPLRTDGELVLGKFWVDPVNMLVLRTQITTKSNGTIESFSRFEPGSLHPLPTEVLVRVELNRIKVPKMMSADLNKKSKPKTPSGQKETGTIRMRFSSYEVNTKLQDAVFAEDAS